MRKGFTVCGWDENRVTPSTEAREIEPNPNAPLASAESLRNFLRSIGIGYGLVSNTLSRNYPSWHPGWIQRRVERTVEPVRSDKTNSTKSHRGRSATTSPEAVTDPFRW